MEHIFKIQVFVPRTHADVVRLAIGETGADKIGNYDYCSSVTEVTSYFRPLPGSHPAIGEIGKIERVPEVKIEFVCEKSKAKEAVAAIRKAHPYEEVAIDIIPLVRPDEFGA